VTGTYIRYNRAVLAGQPLLAIEIEALHLASHGFTNWQIGRVLDLTESGAKDRLRRAMAKLGATDRAHAVRRGFETGYLQPDTPAVRKVAS
jgi:DNA-binding NarL/FixJ family response regulator